MKNALCGVTLIALLTCCTTQDKKDEKITRQRCSSCHSFPDASLLPRDTWLTSVLPEMELRMGHNFDLFWKLHKDEDILASLPATSLVTDAEWEAIVRYYTKNAPDSLGDHSIVHAITDTLHGFVTEPNKLSSFPWLTFTAYNAEDRTFLAGSRLGKIYRLDQQLHAVDSITLPSAPSMLIRKDNDNAVVLLMGNMDPNDKATGQLANVQLKTREIKTLIDSLQRPVYFGEADVDNDGLRDYVICNFGNYTGQLLAFRNKGNGSFERHVIMNVPGARKVVLRDFDNNGLVDILALMTQGDERLVLFLNHGKFEFRVRNLITFPPVYGSSYFELADMNGDGHLDIVYTNGDNADYSMTLKPYHGVRILLNNGRNEFSESWFYNMHGASEAVARDFDKDGDVDIAAVSFFPPFRNHPEQGFIYFENVGGDYVPRVLKTEGGKGRWLRIDAADIDGDGDDDIFLTALDFNKGIPGNLLERWKADPVAILLLRNTAQQAIHQD